jgi:hypothetical protein
MRFRDRAATGGVAGKFQGASMSEFILTEEHQREAESVIFDIVGEGEVEKYARELVWLRARVAELLASNARLQAELAALKAAPQGDEDMVLVPRELMEVCRGWISFGGSSKLRPQIREELQACLAAPAPRVAGAEDVVIPAVVVAAVRGINHFQLSRCFVDEWGAMVTGAENCGLEFGDTPQVSIDNLAAQLEGNDAKNDA